MSTPAGPPVTGEGDEAEVIAKRWQMATREIPLPGWRMKQEAVNEMIDIGMGACAKEAYAAGLARGRELGARDENIACDRIVRFRLLGEANGLADALNHALLDIEARRAGRGT